MAGEHDPLPLIPLLIPVQKLVAVLAEYHEHKHEHSLDQPDGPIDYIDVFISSMSNMLPNTWTGGEPMLQSTTPQMLKMAYRMRSLVVLFDGLDEGVAIRKDLERYFRQVLIPMRIRFLATSRPEAIHLSDYKQDFVIMNLAPLTEAQQSAVVSSQLDGIRADGTPPSPCGAPADALCDAT